MEFERSTLTTAIRGVLLSATLLSAPVLTYAEEAETSSTEEVEKLEKIKVTGSRLQGIDITGAAPIQVITREDIDKGGFSDLSQLIDSVSANNGALPETFSGGFSDGAKGTSLRSLGVNRTLTLINGRRVATYGFAENLTGSFVDLNSISLGAVERVEILLDGASSIYGSDAMTGVVNIILRNDYEGQQVWADVSVPDGGGERASVSYLGGTSTDNANVMVSLNYNTTKPLTYFDRDYAKDPLKENITENSIKDSRQTFGGPGAPFVINLANGQRVATDDCGMGERFTYPSGNTYCLSYYDKTFVPEREQISAVMTGAYNFDSGVELFADAQLSVNNTKYERANTFVYTVRHPDLGFYDAAAMGLSELPGISGVSQAIVAWQMDDLGKLKSDIDTYSGRTVVGGRGTWDMLGDFGRFNDWDWETAAGYSISKTKSTTHNMAKKDVLDNAVDNYEYFYISGLDLNALTGGTIGVTETNSAETLDKIRTSTTRKGTSELYFVDFNTTGSLFELPAGDAHLVVGGELRWEKGEDKPDAQIKAENIHNFGGTGSKGSRNIQSVYSEMNIPIHETLEGIVAVRHEEYSDFGGTTNPTVKLRFQPMDEVMFRGSWGTGFRAPSIAEKFTERSSSFTSVKDTTRCDQYKAANPGDQNADGSKYCRAGSTNIISNANDKLGAETSESFNFGVVMQPADSLTLKADFWQVEIDDVITRLSPKHMVENESDYSEFIDRKPASSDDLADGVTSGEIDSISTRMINVNSEMANGVDLEVKYSYDHYAYGAFGVNFRTSYLNELEVNSQFEGVKEYAGDFAYPRWKARLGLNWVWQQDHDFSLFTNYRHHYTDTTVNASSESADGEPLRISSLTTFDLTYQYTGIKDLVLQVGAINLFDRDPGFSNYGDSGAAIFTDSVMGRTLVGSLGYKF
ncbi:TonB-dependent receptor plug domain-containing protein [Endozoicomonas acroporae]|uniref:TonB-dependent receptor plug domain-containing protein n=1 Tax=Endozoicomonas acroporae TaxID=1701104 RepID=UPI0013CFE7FF|nr:TonB-dependent receptor [Endozoicomonas acroporae]